MRGTTRYARSGEVSIAYQTVGDGPLDLLVVPGFVWNAEILWDEPAPARFFERLASFSRLILYDKREQGQSDRLGRVPTLEEGMDDMRAVLDAAGSERAAIIGVSEGGPLAALFAAAHPGRVSSLILYGTYARMARAPDYPIGVPEEQLDLWVEQIAEQWGGPVAADLFIPSLSDNEHALRFWARFLRSGGSPKTATGLFDVYRKIDIRHALSTISAPVLVLHRRDDRAIRASAGEYLAAHIPGARYVELPGRDHVAWAGEPEPLLDEIEEFLTGSRPRPEPDRVLATVMFTDIVGSTKRAAELGDRRWREVLRSHHALVRRELARYDGREVKTTGDGFLALFDGPARAVRCASAIRDDIRRLGLEIRAGLHTGECETMDGDIGGVAVHIGARVASLAGPGEVLVSSTVKDLVVGSELSFADRGTHVLKGVPGEWRVLAVA